jgi:MOSC domain-containing protein YiiM
MGVELICLAATKAGAMSTPESVRVVAAAGIEGDRHFGMQQKHPGQNLTLIEVEEIERFNARHRVNIALSAPRRNLVTRGVRLNQLVGKDFSVGAVKLRGVELCEPCSKLARNLADTQLTAAQIVKSFAHRAGLRADVLTSGRISRGDAVAELSVAAPGIAQGELF